MIKEATTSFTIYTQRPRQDGTCRIRLRVTFGRRSKYYSTTITLSPDDFKKVTGPKPRGELRDIRLQLNAIEDRAVSIIQSLDHFDFREFDKHFLRPGTGANKLQEIYSSIIEEKMSSGKVSTAINYRDSLSSLLKFDADIDLHLLTPAYLQAYEEWMVKQGRTSSTIGFYLRPLRAVVNIAIENRFLPNEANPFGKRKYVIPSTRNRKQALSKDDIRKLWDHRLEEDSAVAYWKAIWFFSYFCNGMNITDIANLRYRNIEGELLVFIREKTKEATRGDQQPVRVILNQYAQGIIDRYGNKPARPDTYIFPIHLPGQDNMQKVRNMRQASKNMIKYMNRIAQDIDIPYRITTKTARHSYSTIMMQSGKTVEFISKALGHSSTEVTKAYLGNFELEELRNASEILL